MNRTFCILGALLPGMAVLSCGGSDVQQTEAEASDAQSLPRMKAMSTSDCGQVMTLGVGPGTEIIPGEPPAPSPPDFVAKRSWLETPWGFETYRFGRTETVKMKGQFENIGDGPCVPGEKDSIVVHAYLSRGYKEDAHSDWKLVGTDEIQCGNLKPGATHTETEGIELWRDVPGPGIYNIVWCIDHPKSDHNNGGDHAEKHESNNCSSEAVFEVVEGTVNAATVDLTIDGFRVLQAPRYAGDFARFGGFVKNRGTARPATGPRTAYTVSCNGGPAIFLTDDGTDASELGAGQSKWEETITPVRLPDVAGTCTVTMTADYQRLISESDENNNGQSVMVTLLPRPLPDLIITFIEIDPWRDDSIKKGREHHPTMKIKNIGPGPVTTNVRSVYQWYGPSTGYVWQPIADDGTDAAELCVGCEVTETIKSGFKATKKGVHYLRACANYQGQQPESNTANNCLQSGPITVK